MKSRFVHIALIVGGALLAILVALSGQLAAWPSVGLVASALIAGLTSCLKAAGGLGVHEVTFVKQIGHSLGSVVAIVAPILTLVQPFVPEGTKIKAALAVVLPFIGSFDIAFGRGTGALPLATSEDDTKPETPSSKGEPS